MGALARIKEGNFQICQGKVVCLHPSTDAVPNNHRSVQSSDSFSFSCSALLDLP